MHAWTQMLNIGSWQAIFSADCFPQNKQWLQGIPTKKDFLATMMRALLQWTRHNGRLSIPKPDILSCPLLQICGLNIVSPYLLTSQNPPLQHGASLWKVRYFFVRTNRHHRCECFAPTCATSPWRIHSSTTRSLSPWNPSHRPGEPNGFFAGTNLWKKLSMGPWRGTPTLLGLHLGQKEKAVHSGQAHYLLCRFSFQSHVDHLGADDLSVDSCWVLQPLCCWQCVHPPQATQGCPGTRSLNIQPGPGRILHQHRTWAVLGLLVYMLLDFLRPHMNVTDEEVFSVYPGKMNNPGDLVKGRTFRRLNVTRKIVVRDVADLIKTALNMQSCALGPRSFRQRRGRSMGSPLSPALCLMVVSISEQIRSINFKEILANHNLFVRHLRYVDNRLILGRSQLQDLPPYETLLDDGFLWQNLAKNSCVSWLGQILLSWSIVDPPMCRKFCRQSASPPRILFSGFRSRCHIVVKGAFPVCRVHQGLQQLIQVYHLAGFDLEELNSISSQILSSMQ